MMKAVASRYLPNLANKQQKSKLSAFGWTECSSIFFGGGRMERGLFMFYFVDAVYAILYFVSVSLL